MPRLSKLAAVVLLLVAATALPQSTADIPRLLTNPILILDPYEANLVDWNSVSTDRVVKAVIHRAFFGLTQGLKYEKRTATTKTKGLLVNLYLLGKPGDPIKQADALIGLRLWTSSKATARACQCSTSLWRQANLTAAT